MRFLGWLLSFLVIPTLLIVFTPQLQSFEFDVGWQLPSFVVAIYDALLFSVRVPIVALAMFAIVGAALLKKIYRPRVHQPLPGPISQEEVLRLAELAEHADVRVVKTDQGEVATRSVIVDGMNSDVRKLLRVIALADMSPVPKNSLSALHYGDNVTFFHTLQQAVDTGYAKDDGVNFKLTTTGIAWAAEEKRRGLGKRKPPLSRA